MYETVRCRKFRARKIARVMRWRVEFSCAVMFGGRGLLWRFWLEVDRFSCGCVCGGVELGWFSYWILLDIYFMLFLRVISYFQ